MLLHRLRDGELSAVGLVAADGAGVVIARAAAVVGINDRIQNRFLFLGFALELLLVGEKIALRAALLDHVLELPLVEKLIDIGKRGLDLALRRGRYARGHARQRRFGLKRARGQGKQNDARHQAGAQRGHQHAAANLEHAHSPQKQNPERRKQHAENCAEPAARKAEALFARGLYVLG